LLFWRKMKFSAVLLLALVAAVFAWEDHQLALSIPCIFHVNITYTSTMNSQWFDTYGMLNNTRVIYLRQKVFATENYTRFIRFDTRGSERFSSQGIYRSAYQLGRCVDGAERFEELSDFLQKSFVYTDYYTPAVVKCPDELGLAGRSCTQYSSWSRSIVVDDTKKRIVKINDFGGVFFNWIDDEPDLHSDFFEMELCSGAKLSAPKVCEESEVESASIASVSAAVVLLGLALVLF